MTVFITNFLKPTNKMNVKRYNIIVFFSDRPPVKYRNCNNLYRVILYINSRISSNWTAVNVYEKDNKQFIRQFKNGEFIPVTI